VDFNIWSDRDTPAEVARFFRNGAFAVLRRMQQHEKRFEDFLERNAQALLEAPSKDLPTDPAMLKLYLKAKLCGRWPNGVRIKPEVFTQPPEVDENPEFEFKDGDEDAKGCPFGAHIRRGNPRDDHVLPLRRRPLFRRGVPYVYEHKNADGTVVEERGLLGVFFCASIEDQFEHVLSEWVEKMPMGPPSRGDAKDPILGHHDGSDTVFHIPGSGAGIRLKGFNEPFVTTRGTLYALFPSRRALQEIAAFVDS
jgi:deferrochelatase/peroxidase EfeB